jgi:hypothetical protein
VSVFRFARVNEKRILGNAAPRTQALRDEIAASCCENATVATGPLSIALTASNGRCHAGPPRPCPAAAMAQAKRRA